MVNSGWKKTGQNVNGVWFYGYVNNSANIPNTGDVIIFYDWKHDNVMDHASYCVGTGTSSDSTGSGDFIDAHTSDRAKTIWHLDHWIIHRDTTAIYAFQL